MESGGKVILYPSMGVNHIVAMVEIGKLIHTHHPSLSIIILVIPTPSESASSKYIKTVSATTPSITFHHLPALTLPPDFSSDFVDRAFGVPELYNPVVYDTLAAMSHIKAVILDFFSNAAFQVCKISLDLPTYYLFTGSASGLCVLLYLPAIHKTTTKSIKDLNVFFDVPGTPRIHSSFMAPTLFDRDTNSYKNFLKTATNMAKSSGIFVNSFLDLEKRAAKALHDGKCIPEAEAEAQTPPICLLGPLTASGDQKDNIAAYEKELCLDWLKTQPSKSVVFLCFGSMGVFQKEQLAEIALGLEKSGQRFLWTVRNPIAGGGKEFDLDEILPQGFLTRTKDKGLVVKNWAPQLAILGHESVGGFVSHCGWGSSLEAVVCGVPMVAWPLYAEQKMNRVFLVEEIKVALWLTMSADGFVAAEAVEETVRKLMDGEEGRAVRERVLEMSGRAKAAVKDDGCSRVDFLKLIQQWNDHKACEGY